MENEYKSRSFAEEKKDLVKEKLPVAVDFDGCMVEHCYPRIGRENDHCVETLKKWTKNGIGVILYTMRSGKELKEAIEWCKEKGIDLYGVNRCPGQDEWTDSMKCYAVLYVDDSAATNYLIPVKGGRPRVDWQKVDKVYTDWLINLAKS